MEKRRARALRGVRDFAFRHVSPSRLTGHLDIITRIRSMSFDRFDPEDAFPRHLDTILVVGVSNSIVFVLMASRATPELWLKSQE
jgi:hypothetical protein